MENEFVPITEIGFRRWMIRNFCELKEHVLAQCKETKNLEKRFDEILMRIDNLEMNIRELLELKNTIRTSQIRRKSKDKTRGNRLLHCPSNGSSVLGGSEHLQKSTRDDCPGREALQAACSNTEHRKLWVRKLPCRQPASPALRRRVARARLRDRAPSGLDGRLSDARGEHSPHHKTEIK
ncbi:LINE-1 retrotransposable element ORF1 protein [Plecturocebus cupreus]